MSELPLEINLDHSKKKFRGYETRERLALDSELPDLKLDRAQFLVLNILGEMTRTTGIIISGCGCCGSPYTRSSKSGSKDDDNISEFKWDSGVNQYFCKLGEFSELICYEDGSRWGLPEDLEKTNHKDVV